MKQDLFEKITARLHEGATNYSVFLQAYEMTYMQPMNSDTLLRAVLGAEATLGGIDEVDATLVCAEVADALFYPGDDDAGPGDSVLRSESFVELIEELKEELLRLAGTSHKIQRFWLKDGHPAYPVFWDFAFLFWAEDKATIFIGSSSD